MFPQRAQMVAIVSKRQKSGVKLGMQRFDAAIEHLGKFSHARYFLHAKPRFFQKRRGPSRRDELHSQAMQGFRKAHDARFVVHADQGSFYFYHRFNALLKSRLKSSVTGPGTPFPIVRPSKQTTGRISDEVLVRKHSSAL